jgi:O-antigen ligase
LAAGVFSLVNAQDLQVSMIALVSMGKAFLLYLVVANSIENSQDAAWLVGGMLVALAFEALLGSYQGLTGHYVGLSFLGEGTNVMKYSLGEVTVNRCEGTVCHPNSLAMYLNSCLPFAMALAFTHLNRILRILAVMLVGTGILALMLTLSRGGWIGLLLSSSLVLGLAVLRGRLKIGFALLLTVCLLVLVTILLTSGPNLVTNRLTANDRGSAQSRIPMAMGALKILQAYPILGVGLNNYSLYMPEYDPITFAAEHGPYIVHNTFLLIGAETGLLGLAGFTWFLVSVILQAWRLLKIVHNDLFWIVGVGIFCGYITLSVHSTVDFALIGCPRVFTQVWFLAGLVVGFTHMASPGRTIVARSTEDPPQSL